MVILAPGATYRPVGRNFNRDPWTDSYGLILHVQAGYNSPFGWFQDPECDGSSHWWVGRDGTIEQYYDPDNDQAWAQGEGNFWYHSVETEGFPGDPLTDSQVGTLARLYQFGHERYRWPLQLAERPGQRGFGWHGMGGNAWGGHFDCPGGLRKAQRARIINGISSTITMEDGFMGIYFKDRDDLKNSIMDVRPANAGEPQSRSINRVMDIDKRLTAVEGKIDTLIALIKAKP